MSEVGTISVHVMLLGPSRDFAGVGSCDMTLSQPSTIADVRIALGNQFPGLAPALPTVRFAVNDGFVMETTELRDGDEVAVIPPVSGGSRDVVHTELTHREINPERVRRFVGGDSRFGGIVTFEGCTRCESDPEHGELVRLDYESYESMAQKQLERLALLAVERWGPGRIAVVHRMGSVPPGEVSVVICVAFGHRKQAFEACRWLIDALKQEVPIWKKDVFEDDFVRWAEGESNTADKE